MTEPSPVTPQPPEPQPRVVTPEPVPGVDDSPVTPEPPPGAEATPRTWGRWLANAYWRYQTQIMIPATEKLAKTVDTYVPLGGLFVPELARYSALHNRAALTAIYSKNIDTEEQLSRQDALLAAAKLEGQALWELGQAATEAFNIYRLATGATETFRQRAETDKTAPAPVPTPSPDGKGPADEAQTEPRKAAEQIVHFAAEYLKILVDKIPGGEKFSGARDRIIDMLANENTRAAIYAFVLTKGGKFTKALAMFDMFNFLIQRYRQRKPQPEVEITLQQQPSTDS